MKNIKYKILTFVILLSSLTTFGQAKNLIKSFKLGNVGYTLYSQIGKPNKKLTDTTFYLLYRVGNTKVLGKEIKAIKEKSSSEILEANTYQITASAITFTKNGYENRRYLQNSKGKLSFEMYDSARSADDIVGSPVTQAPPPPSSGAVMNAVENAVLIDHVDILPEYPGGINNARKYVGEHVEYPDEAVENDIEGTIIVTFVIERDGSVTDIKIDKGLGYGLDQEVLRVMRSMPKWTPAKLNGEFVRYRMRMPVTFKLA